MKKVELTVTELEAKVLTSLAGGMYAELGYSDFGPTDISKDTGINMNILRGVLGSLSKKGLIECDRREDEGYGKRIDMWICYLLDDAVGLVDIWREESNIITELIIKN